MCEVIGSVLEQAIGTRRRYSVSWVDMLTPEIAQYPALARDRISTSAWAIAADSPATGVTITGEGFDDGLGIAWVSLESDGTLSDGDTIYLSNTITTTGIMPQGDLETQTSDQVLIRQYRIRFKDC